ncbi:hypothetical protein C8J56DRAFT_1162429 [Mycena floridula]|nr:hypothetical protein C8J56DRAFT_1162429 [Mycena floridula]
MTIVAEQTRVLALLTFSINLAANILPADLMHVGTIAFVIAGLFASYIHHQLPPISIAVLQSLLKEIDGSVNLLADTDHGLWFRASLQSLKHSASVYEMEHLQLSNTPWSAYLPSLFRLVQSIRAVTGETRGLLIAVKNRLELERQSAHRGHTVIDIAKPPIASNYPTRDSSMQYAKPRVPQHL